MKRPARAQLSLLETALWPLDTKTLSGAIYETGYLFTASDTKKRKRADVQVRAPLGIQPYDEYLLWGLLSLTVARGDDPLLLATPYWCLKQLGLPTGGKQYRIFRSALDRLASASYHCDHFYNPVVKRHQFVTFGFFSIYLPVEIDSPQSWGIQWDPIFFEMCRATGGNLLFDLDLYRKLSPAERRLFLMLHDRFYRSSRVLLNVDQLTIQGLGYAAHRPLKKRKYHLTKCMKSLAEQGIIQPGRGQSDVSQCFYKNGKGSFVATFYPGPYFRHPSAARPRKPQLVTEDPLFQPLSNIGFEEAAIARIFSQFSRKLVQEKIRTTEIAMHEKPKGFPGFKASAPAFCFDQLKHRHPKPDWQHDWEKSESQRKWQEDHAKFDDDEQMLRTRYESEQQEVLTKYISSEGSQTYQKALASYLELYQKDPNAHQQATESARQHVLSSAAFKFPAYSVWALDKHVQGDR